MANIQPSTVEWNGQPRTLERGEIITSLLELSELGECDRKTVLRHLNYLALRKTVFVERSFGGVFLKINNYERYQGQDAEDSQIDPNCIPTASQMYPNSVPHNEELKNKRIKERKNTLVELPRLAVLWNEHSGQLPKVFKSNLNRNKKAATRFSEHSEGEWVDIIKRIANSQFCNGQNDRGWKADFEFLIKPDTALKAIEGTYDNRKIISQAKLNEGYQSEQTDEETRKALGL